MTLNDVESLEESAQQALAAARKARMELMRNCSHPASSVVEGKYKEGNFLFYASPSFRVCKECGYAEEGWGCGHYLLNSKCEEVERDEAFKHVKLFLNNERVTDFRLKRLDPFKGD